MSRKEISQAMVTTGILTSVGSALPATIFFQGNFSELSRMGVNEVNYFNFLGEIGAIGAAVGLAAFFAGLGLEKIQLPRRNQQILPHTELKTVHNT